MNVDFTRQPTYLIFAVFLVGMQYGFAQDSKLLNASVVQGCAPLSVSFSIEEINIKNYIWEFSNGARSTLKEPTILFSKSGQYDVKLTLVYDDNRSEELLYNNYITVHEIPNPDFHSVRDTYCFGDSVVLINNSENASSYIWDFGDGTNSIEINPKHVYENSGAYTVKLVAFNESGCSNIKVVDKISVQEKIDLDFTSNKQIVCSSDSIISFTPNKDYKSYNWNFGDGTSSLIKNPTHSFKNIGDYSVSLQVEDQDGCKSQVVKNKYISLKSLQILEIELSDSVICNDQPILFSNKTKNTKSVSWNIGNLVSSQENQFQHQFNTPGSYDLNVVHEDKNGCIQASTSKDLIKVLEVEKIDIDISQSEGCVPMTVHFSNKTKNAIDYRWEIGDDVIHEKSMDITFTEAGIISVKAYTKYSSGCQSEYVMDSAIIVRKSDTFADVSKKTGCMPLETSFSLSSQNVTNVHWEFGNGQSSDLSSPTVTYAEAGKYEVEVTFTNEFGCRKNIKLDKKIHVYDTAIAYEESQVINICPFEEVRFSGDLGRDSWLWNFGDGTTSTEKNPIHQFTSSGRHTVKLETQNSFGCPVTIMNYNQVIVNEVSPVDFKYEVKACTDELEVSFEGIGHDSLTYKWDFGDGGTANGIGVDHQFENLGYYQIKLITSDPLGCKGITVKTARIQYDDCPGIDPQGGGDSISFGINPPLPPGDLIEVCSAPFEISFENPSPGALSYFWDFKDGFTSEESDPTHTYKEPGEFEVDLIVTSESGKIDSIKNLVKVVVIDQKVDFSFTSKSLCDAVSVNFRDISEAPTLWSWDFGDGDTSNIQHPGKKYVQEGIFQVSLVATDEKGCSKRTVHNVAIGNPYYYLSIPEEVCAEDSLLFNHNIEGFKNYVWDFGDGNTLAGKNPIHQYKDHGLFMINLEVEDEFNCKKRFTKLSEINVFSPIARFEVLGDTVGCGTLEVQFVNHSTNADSWLWDFGNGITSSEKDPVIKYSSSGVFTISLTAFSGACSNTYVKKDAIVIHDLEAGYSFSQEDICFPVEVKFKDKSTNASEWLWDFGDGETSTEKNPVHTFTEKPLKNISLRVKDLHGCTSKKEEEPPVFYQTEFIVEKNMGCIPFTTSFHDQTDGGTKWLWDFGDGNISTEQNPSVTYEEVGQYSVTLITSSQTGCRDTLTIDEMIQVGHIETSFSVNFPESLCSPLVARFSNRSQGADSFNWDFGDGILSSSENPVHIYTKVGLFDVQLISQNELGCSDTIWYKDMVKTLGPEADFHLSDSVLCHPQEFQIVDKSVSATQWEWFFGDGNTTTVQHPSYQYKDPGTYNIALLATDGYGCKELIEYDSVKVFKTPKAFFEIDEYENCQPAKVQVENQTLNTQNVSYLWDFGNGEFSHEINPQIPYHQAGSYRLSLTSTNESVCSDTFVLDSLIHVRDTFHLKQPAIFQLTVNSAGEILIKSNPYTRNNFKYNIVYRKSQFETDYHFIDTVSDGLTTNYVDNQVETHLMDYSYKFQSHVYCNNPVELKDLTTFKSIHLRPDILENSIELDWTPYLGNNFEQYTILRMSENERWKDVAKVSYETSSYLDKEDLCPVDHNYKIVANNLDGLNFHSMSNVISVHPKINVFKTQKVDIVRSTVVDHNLILTEWNDPLIGPDKVLSFRILRSENGADFKYFEEVPKGINSFLDEEVRTDENYYQYKIIAINSCNVSGQLSNRGSSVLLRKDTDKYYNFMYWTPYEEWEHGVKEYQLQKKNEYGKWETIEYLAPDVNSFEIDLSLE